MQVEKAVVWFWPWGGVPSDSPEAGPQHMVEPVASDAAGTAIALGAAGAASAVGVVG